MIPARFAPLLFGLVLSGLMSFVVSGIATFRAIGPVPHFAGLWSSAWLTAWAVAFPIVLVAAPMARRLVQRLVAGGSVGQLEGRAQRGAERRGTAEREGHGRQ